MITIHEMEVDIVQSLRKTVIIKDDYADNFDSNFFCDQ